MLTGISSGSEEGVVVWCICCHAVAAHTRTWWTWIEELKDKKRKKEKATELQYNLLSRFTDNIRVIHSWRSLKLVQDYPRQRTAWVPARAPMASAHWASIKAVLMNCAGTQNNGVTQTRHVASPHGDRGHPGGVYLRCDRYIMGSVITPQSARAAACAAAMRRASISWFHLPTRRDRDW